MARLQDNVAIVAGGAMGIGKAAALALAPGTIFTPMNTCIEVAAAVVFLASGEVSFIAGECVCVSMAV
jgi:NAD(P)-dependent dehydrogenase (short-subunit alcohol dehydrogenase family)